MPTKVNPSYPQPQTAPQNLGVLRRLTQQELEHNQEISNFSMYGPGNHYDTQVPLYDVNDPYPFQFAVGEIF